MAQVEKKAFYDSLYALDQSSDGERDLGFLSSVEALAYDRPHGDTVTPLARQTSTRNRQPVTRSSAISRTVSAPISSAPVRDSRPLAGLPPDKTMKQAMISPPPKLQRFHTTTGTSLFPDKVMKSGGKRKRDDGFIALPEDRQIFKGLHFYFFPANDIHPGRKMRITKARQYGAIWVKQWDDTITHIIADRSMTYDQVLKYLKLEGVPSNIALVNEDYPAECISYKMVLPVIQRQYRVQGHPEPTELKPISNAIPTSSAVSDRSLELKPAGRAVMAREPQTPSSREQDSVWSRSSEVNDNAPSSVVEPAAIGQVPQASYNDDLESLIEQTKHLQHMPLDEDEEEGSRPTSSSSREKEAESSDEEMAKPCTSSKANPQWQDNFQCMKKHTGKNGENPNAQTIAILQEMADYYTQIRDEWRPFAYRRAIASLRNCSVKVTSRDQAITIPFVGERLAVKIEEIAYTNRLRRLDNAKAEPTDKTLQLFLKVYGAGFAQASKWVAQGHRTLDDLVKKADLSENHKIGIQHYVDFDTRVPRAEVEQHGNIVRAATLKLDADFQVYTMGSYRRGATDSGDIDLIITHPYLPIHQIRTLVTDTLVPRLFAQKFLKATLAATSQAGGTKWHGASCLPTSTIWRRIDLLLVPVEELGAALIYFTGNDIFNRSLRLLASKKGMRLNQKGLYKDVMRGKGRVKLSEGTLVEGRDERRIFEALGVPWRPPEHRSC